MFLADLPWYDFAELRAHTDAWWQGIAKHLTRQGVVGLPAVLSRDGDYAARWRQPNLLLSQACADYSTGAAASLPRSRHR